MQSLPGHSNIASSTLQPCHPGGYRPKVLDRPSRDDSRTARGSQALLLQRLHVSCERYRRLCLENAALLRRLYHAKAAQLAVHRQPCERPAAESPVKLMPHHCPPQRPHAPATARPLLATALLFRRTPRERQRPLSSFRCRARLAPSQLVQLARGACSERGSERAAPPPPAQRFAAAGRAYMARVAVAAGCRRRDVCWFMESSQEVAAPEHMDGCLSVSLSLGSDPCIRSWVLLTFALQLEARMLLAESACPPSLPRPCTRCAHRSGAIHESPPLHEWEHRIC